MLRIVFVGLFSLLVGSYLGAFHPLGDSLAVIRIPVALATLLALLLWRRGWVFRLCGLFAICVLITIALDRWRTTGPDGPYTVYQKNLWFANQSLPALAKDIENQGTDIVFLQEVSGENLILLKLLEKQFSHQHFCPISNWSGVAVVSKFPIIAGSEQCSDWRAFAAAQVQTPDGPVWAVSLHLFWPYPRLQSRQLKRILPKIAALKGPVILVGDFNMLPGTRVERVISNATKSQALRPAFTTLHVSRHLRVPVSIDQILAPCGTVKRRPKLGSDHHGLVAHVGINPHICRE